MSDNSNFMDQQGQNLYGWAKLEEWDVETIKKVFNEWLQARADDGYIGQCYDITWWTDENKLSMEFLPSDSKNWYGMAFAFPYLGHPWEINKPDLDADYERAMRGI